MAKRETSPAQLRAYQKYIGNTDEIRVRVPKGTKQLVTDHLERTGETMQDFIIRAIMEAMAKDEKAQYKRLKSYNDLLMKKLQEDR